MLCRDKMPKQTCCLLYLKLPVRSRTLFDNLKFSSYSMLSVDFYVYPYHHGQIFAIANKSSGSQRWGDFFPPWSAVSSCFSHGRILSTTLGQNNYRSFKKYIFSMYIKLRWAFIHHNYIVFFAPIFGNLKQISAVINIFR